MSLLEMHRTIQCEKRLIVMQIQQPRFFSPVSYVVRPYLAHLSGRPFTRVNTIREQ